MDGLLVIDKPSGPTSHDVVARMRQVLREKRIGHTGTLDPLATGVLPLVLGRATRLARFLSGSDKKYEAVITLGIATDTADAHGTAVGAPHEGPLPTARDVERALDAFRGSFLQQPPAYSAKKIGGLRSYDLARASAGNETKPISDLPGPMSVSAYAIELVSAEGPVVTLRVHCSAGFYVRSLAHDLGERLGTGAHLVALRRTRSAGYGLDAAMPLDEAERDAACAAAAVIPMGRMLPDFPTVTLASEDIRLAVNGRDIAANPETTNPNESPIPNPKSLLLVRLIDEAGDLVGLGEPSGTPGLLHPSVILR